MKKHIIKVCFKRKVYELEYEKIHYVLSALEKKKLPKLSDEKILELIEYYHLRDEIFLESMKNAWK